MTFIADLHIHSKYSRATARNLDLEIIAGWAIKKGIDLVATGDFTHPKWFDELKEKLVSAEEGFFKLKDKKNSKIRFCLSVEISSIYKSEALDGSDPAQAKVRRVHNLIFLPSLEDAEKFNKKLGKIGNIKSDGRPILGLSSRALLEILLETAPDGFLIPAHIWTPHFSVLGAQSGFDSVEACFGDLTQYIFALETGLSADPPMCRRLSMLDRYSLVSNSDAHSPANLGREANIFSCNFNFSSMKKALMSGKGFEGTIEFFPEEGKYHLDGHRNCERSMTPHETIAADGLCPDCGRKVTIGVLHRVETLADRAEGMQCKNPKPFIRAVPLAEIVGEILKVGSKSKKVVKEYERLISEIAPEIEILTKTPIDKISEIAGESVAASISRMRRGKAKIFAGYDGEYGKISLLAQ